MKVQCDYCRKETNKKSTFVKRNKHNFCNRDCFLRFIAKPKIVCDYCGRELSRSPSQIHKTNFCDHVCSAQYRKQKVTLVCDFCGKEFERKQSAALGRLYHFCSHECYSQYRQERQPVTKCDYCDRLISRSVSSLNKFNHCFCGLDCRNKFMQKREKTHCYYCGTNIERPPSLLQDKKHVFCDSDCYHTWYRGENHACWQGGNYIGYYGPDWEQQRRKARKRDGYSCRICGITEKELEKDLSVHHLIPFSHFGSEQHELANCLCNLCSLCQSHHAELEHLSLNDQVKRLNF